MANGACVEVRLFEHLVEVRDSKSRSGSVLRFDRTAWAIFIEDLKRQQFASAGE
jgi:hypothetical protein